MHTSSLLKLHVLVAIIITTLLGSSAYGSALYRFNNKTHTATNLPPSLMQRLYEANLHHYHEIDRIISEQLFENSIMQEAKKAKKTAEQVKKEILAVEKIDEKEIKKFYEENKARIPYDYEKAKPQLLRYLQAKKRAAAHDDFLARVKNEGKYQLLLVKPAAPTFTIDTRGFPSKGKDQAKVTIVEFFDYQCSHCREASEHLRAVLPRFKDKVRVVNIDFPVNRSGISTVVAQGAYCAKNQGKYWQYHDLAFSKQSELNTESPAQLAAQLKMDTEKFKSCMASKEAQQFVARGKREAQRLGLEGTPSFFVNGRKLIFSDLRADLEKAITDALAAH